ncbi:MAG: zinc-finger domain-containing protein [Candidatus Tisiphia sp.]
MEIIETISTSVSCFGKEPPFDHPRIYLEIDSIKGSIVCPYCSKTFVLVSNEDKTPIR